MATTDEPILSFIAGHGLIDVVFVHGFGGAFDKTWMSSSSDEPDGPFWPAWLSADIPSIAVYSLGYPASRLARWNTTDVTLHERAKAVLELLAARRIGQRPLVFVCHSLGGLLVKQILRVSRESADTRWLSISENTHGILFVATPHLGAALATIVGTLLADAGSLHFKTLADDNHGLRELHDSLRSMHALRPIHIVSYYETHKLPLIGLVVDSLSADAGIGSVPAIPIDADHIAISKPRNRSSVMYVSIHRHLVDIVDNLGLDQTSAADALIAILTDLQAVLTLGSPLSPALNNDMQLRITNYERTTSIVRPALVALRTTCDTYSKLPTGIGQAIHRRAWATQSGAFALLSSILIDLHTPNGAI